MQQAVRDALIAFMRYRACQAAWRPNLHRPQTEVHTDQFNKMRVMLGQEVVNIAQIAKQTALIRQTVYPIKGDPAGC
jgi:hypothetical protein